ncbi:MAG: hypothetical protein ABI696_03580 [Rubrivivax sp.]
MQPAPAVSFDCADDGRWRAVRVVLPALAAFVTALWAAAWSGWPGGLAAGVAAVVAAAVGGWRWRRTADEPPMRLAWDCQHWRLHGAAGPASEPLELRVAIAVGDWMLLRLRPEARARGSVWRASRSRWLAVHGVDGAARAALVAAPVRRRPGGADPWLTGG